MESPYKHVLRTPMPTGTFVLGGYAFLELLCTERKQKVQKTNLADMLNMLTIC